MYQQEITAALQQRTKEWLAAIKTTDKQNTGDIESLRDVLRFHEYRYYVQNDPLITDGEYDSLYKLLEHFEKDDPALVTPDSPTQRVGKGLVSEFAKVEHLVPMLSLENSYNVPRIGRVSVLEGLPGGGFDPFAIDEIVIDIRSVGRSCEDWAGESVGHLAPPANFPC